MYDDIRAYPGSVSITISGTAASAATMLCMAADELEMTPGSLFMIHDPSMMAFGNEQDLSNSINLLRACKESILNMYERRARVSRTDTATMMTATTWMDAKSACEYGFVDNIVDDPVKYPVNSVENHTVDMKTAKEKVNDWLERKKKSLLTKTTVQEEASAFMPNSMKSDEHIEIVEPFDKTVVESIEPIESIEPPTLPEEPQNTPDISRIKVILTDTRLENLKY